MSDWGVDVERTIVRGSPCLVYRDRPRAVPELLLEARRWDADRDALVELDRRVTIAGLEDAVRRMATWLRDDGVGPGDRVALHASNSIEWVVAFWAVQWAGGVVVLANGWWKRAMLGPALELVAPALVLTDAPRAAEIPSRHRSRSLADVGTEAGGGPPLADDVWRARDEDDPAVVVFTAGTTGDPKGATLSHRGVVANIHNLLLLTGRRPGSSRDARPGPTTLVTVPLFHMGGVQTLGIAAVTGARLVILPRRFDAATTLATIEAERVESWGAVPTMVTRVLDHPDLDRRDTSSLTSLTIGGSTVAPELAARARAGFPSAPRGVGTVYGLTESGGTLTAGSGSDLCDRPGTVGRPLPVVELRIVGADARGVGEVVARTPAAMLGYWGEGSELDADGWLHTGDLGYLDADGYLYIVDRSKDVVIRGGENVASAHVEARLLSHPAISEAAVLGLAHTALGEEVAAAVVPIRDATVSEEELREHVATALASFEVPTRWWIRREPLPTSAVGKVLKRELRDTWPVEIATPSS